MKTYTGLFFCKTFRKQKSKGHYFNNFVRGSLDAAPLQIVDGQATDEITC